MPKNKITVKPRGPRPVPGVPALSPEALQSEFMTCRECSLFLKISEISVRRLLTQKKLTRYKCGSRTLILQSQAAALIHEVE